MDKKWFDKIKYASNWFQEDKYTFKLNIILKENLSVKEFFKCNNA